MNDLFADISWRLGFGDPNLVGWLITVAHFVAAMFCLRAQLAASASKLHDNKKQRRFWLFATAFMLGLCLNKQLDLQTLFTQLGRQIAMRDGWYEQRRPIQAVFVLACAAIGAVCILVTAIRIRHHWRNYGVAFLGIIFLTTFIVVRAASFHHIDTILYRLPIVGIWMNACLELGGSLLVSVGTLLAIRQNSVPETSVA